MDVPKSLIRSYVETLRGIDAAARRSIIDGVAGYDAKDMTDLIDRCAAVTERACGMGAALAAQAAAEFFATVRAASVPDDGFAPDAAPTREPKATEAAVRGMAAKLVAGSQTVEGFARALADRASYEVRRQAASTMAANVAADPRKPRWARVPGGGETCGWCMMLASNGYSYASEAEAAGRHWHANCDCSVVPVYGGSSIEGFDAQVRECGEAYRAARDSIDFEAEWDALGDDYKAAHYLDDEGFTSYDKFKAARIASAMTKAAKAARAAKAV